MRRAKPKVTARQTPSREHVLGSYRHRSGICLLAWALFRGRKKTACADRRLLSDRENTSCPHAPALNELRWTGRLWNQRVQTWATGQYRYKPFRMNDFILMGCQLQPYAPPARRDGVWRGTGCLIDVEAGLEHDGTYRILTREWSSSNVGEFSKVGRSQGAHRGSIRNFVEQVLRLSTDGR